MYFFLFLLQVKHVIYYNKNYNKYKEQLNFGTQFQDIWMSQLQCLRIC